MELAYDLLVGTLHSKMLHFWKLMGIGEFFMRISFIVVAVIALRALTCPVTHYLKFRMQKLPFGTQNICCILYRTNTLYYSVPAL
jgi:hypothetical protein